MQPSQIGFDSYVDIAIFFAAQGCRYTGSHSTSNYSEMNLEVSSLAEFRRHWSDKINLWQAEYPDGGPPFENCETLEDIKLCTFFLQHPVAAMLLWKVMRAFYSLDNVVCGVLPSSTESISEWKKMNIFQYLKASKVERKWRNSLANMRKDIEGKHHLNVYSRAKANHLRTTVFPVAETNKDEENVENSIQEMNSRINDMRAGVDQLERTWEDLQRDFLEDISGSEKAKLMVEEIGVAVERRFSMLDTCLKRDIILTNIPERNSDEVNPRPSFVTFDSEFPNPKIDQAERHFRPLKRTSSIEAVKEYAIVVFIATKQGEATLGAICLILILLFCLYQLQGCIEV